MKTDTQDKIDEVLDELVYQCTGKRVIPSGHTAGTVPYEEFAKAKAAINRLIVEARIEELQITYREIVKNDIAGNVKWHVSDRIDELKAKLGDKE